jgi:hypothetical protein
MGGREVVDPEVEVDLLLNSIRPLRALIVLGLLHSNTWLTVDQDRAPIAINLNNTPEYTCPELGFSVDVGSIEGDNLEPDLHSVNLQGGQCCWARPRLDE